MCFSTNKWKNRNSWNNPDITGQWFKFSKIHSLCYSHFRKLYFEVQCTVFTSALLYLQRLKNKECIFFIKSSYTFYVQLKNCYNTVLISDISIFLLNFNYFPLSSFIFLILSEDISLRLFKWIKVETWTFQQASALKP